VTHWDAVLEGDADATSFVQSVLTALPREPDELNVQLLLDLLEQAYWRFLSSPGRVAVAHDIEVLLWSELERAETSSRKATYFESLTSIALTPETLDRLEGVWSGAHELPGLPLGEQRLTALAEALALRNVPAAKEILHRQLERIENPDRRARFAFVVPALSAETAARDSVFTSFRDPANREHEPWVLSAMAYLNHPLRADHAVRYVRPALDLLEEIQRTGDIFFPLRWLHATLDGHATREAADIVRAFLAEHPDYPARLRGKILQAADGLFRTAALRTAHE
jgi:aminopeptidase N